MTASCEGLPSAPRLQLYGDHSVLKASAWLRARRAEAAPRDAGVLDVDGDGDNDVLVFGANGAVVMHENLGDCSAWHTRTLISERMRDAKCELLKRHCFFIKDVGVLSVIKAISGKKIEHLYLFVSLHELILDFLL